MPISIRRTACALVPLLVAIAPATAAGQPDSGGTPNELDIFMEKVLARREQNRLALERYVLDEVERFELLGPARTPLYGQHREYTWYVRDGLHVRSPVRFNGVAVGDRDRAEYEEDWIRRERERLERRRKDEESDARAGAPGVLPGEQAMDASGATPIPTPRFVSEAYFLEFKFEAGNYYLAGREQFEGKEVLRIEYYPEQMFREKRDRDESGAEARTRAERKRDREFEDRINRQMNKTALITLWVDPSEHQIVKYTFQNVWMDFLPGAWLVRVDEIGASMTMGQPFPDVWLPHELSVRGQVTLANGSYEGEYRRQFSEYRLAEVSTRIKIPKIPDPPEAPLDDWPEDRPSGPYAPDRLPAGDQPHARETVAEIRVHGNVAIPDADVIRLADVQLGQSVSDEAIAAIERRLKDSGLFESVEVRKRYRSLTDASAVALLLLVHERPGVTSVEQKGDFVTGTWRRFRNMTMFLPILTYDDGYGFTYGGRVSTVDLLGAGERLSVPLTWGGTRRAALEFERTFPRGPLTRIASSFGISQRENPHYGLDDQRVELRGRAERHFARVFRTGMEASTASVEFGTEDDRLGTVGADAALDTRRAPAFPRNAVYLGAAWTSLHFRERAERIDRYTADARGYLGAIGQSVVAARVQYSAAGASLPGYERLLLGGASTLRGFRAGAFSGDRMFVTSAELRVPLTSVLNRARLGVTVFVDAARAYDAGERFDAAPWHRAAGGGVFLIASVVRINIDVARGLKDGATRVHVGMGFPF